MRSAYYFFCFTIDVLVSVNEYDNCRLVSLKGKVPVYRAGGLGSIPDRTNTRVFKIIEEKVLPLL